MKKFSLTLAAALAVVTVCSAVHPTLAQSDSKMGSSKMAPAAKTYYVCAKCKTYFSAAAATKMKMKDAMGHALTKSATIPKGYTDGTKAKKADKMSKM